MDLWEDCNVLHIDSRVTGAGAAARGAGSAGSAGAAGATARSAAAQGPESIVQDSIRRAQVDSIMQ